MWENTSHISASNSSYHWSTTYYDVSSQKYGMYSDNNNVRIQYFRFSPYWGFSIRPIRWLLCQCKTYCIFLPAGGQWTETNHFYKEQYGYYWRTTWYNYEYARALFFDSTNVTQSNSYIFPRPYGLSVRARQIIFQSSYIEESN